MKRMEELKKLAVRRRLDAVLVFDRANIRALTGIDCDSACLTSEAIYTDFRYAAMIRRSAPSLKVRDIRRLKVKGRRIGYEPSIPHSRFLRLRAASPKAVFVDIEAELTH